MIWDYIEIIEITVFTLHHFNAIVHQGLHKPSDAPPPQVPGKQAPPWIPGSTSSKIFQSNPKECHGMSKLVESKRDCWNLLQKNAEDMDDLIPSISTNLPPTVSC